MEKINYNKLYKLQDDVLKFINSLEHHFYLTGGTALNRFILKNDTRYSDDLDFFISSKNKNIDIDKEMSYLILSLQQKYSKSKIESNFKDFKRIIIFKQNISLQIDFVNDMVERFGKNQIHNNIVIDNIVNILTNKISAIMSRDEEKDIYDLFLISKNFDFNWNKIISLAQKKEHFQNNDFIIRLKSFPIVLLDNIKTENSFFIDEIKKNLHILIKDVENQKQNSIFQQSLSVEDCLEDYKTQSKDLSFIVLS